jgi:lysyl-tRNA synthetase class 1
MESNMSDEKQSKYWLEMTAKKIMEQHPEGEIVVESGHSPSGWYHVGSIREQVTTNALVLALRQAGRQAKHLDFVDDFDVLRKLPVGIDESFSQHLGKPLYLAPDPFGSCHQSYAEHFYAELVEARRSAGCQPDETVRDSQTYPAGKFTQIIETTLSQLPKVKQTIERVAQRQLAQDWAPVQILSDEDRLDQWFFQGWDQAKQVVRYQSKDGSSGEVSYASGRIKLDWRLDWVGHWLIWDVSAEPFGRDHATKGGSYDTGRALIQDVFGSEPPLPVPYEFVNVVGQSKKLSKSAGGVITPLEATELMPAEILRYFMLRSRPEKQLFFDSGMGLANLIDEFAAAGADEQHEFRDAYNFAVAGSKHQIISTVPFKHLVAVYQSARGDDRAIMDTLERTGYERQVKHETNVILDELEFIKNWLAKYAPEDIKFAIQKALPQVELSDDQHKFLKLLAESLENSVDDADLSGQEMHELIYAAKDTSGLPPGQAFQAIYRVILGKDAGPKAGWFLASLDRNWLIKRLQLEN